MKCVSSGDGDGAMPQNSLGSFLTPQLRWLNGAFIKVFFEAGCTCTACDSRFLLKSCIGIRPLSPIFLLVSVYFLNCNPRVFFVLETCRYVQRYISNRFWSYTFPAEINHNTALFNVIITYIPFIKREKYFLLQMQSAEPNTVPVKITSPSAIRTSHALSMLHAGFSDYVA